MPERSRSEGAMPRPKTDPVKITLRMPPEVHKALEVSAAENLRSLNSEILRRLILTLKTAAT